MGGKATIEWEALVSDDGSFRVLPVETVVKIASQLVVSDVMKFSMASHGLQQYIGDSYNLWNFLLQRDFQKTSEDVDPEDLKRIRVKHAILMVADDVARDLMNHQHSFSEVRELVEEIADTFDYSYFESLDQLQTNNDTGVNSSSEDSENNDSRKARNRKHCNAHAKFGLAVENKFAPIGVAENDTPPSLREEAIRLIKDHLASGARIYRIYQIRDQSSIIPVPDEFQLRKPSLTVSRRNKVKDVQRPFDVYKRLNILFHSQGLKHAAREKGYREVDTFIVNNKLEFEKENLKLVPRRTEKIVSGPNVITVAVTGPPQSGVSTLLHSLITNPERGAAFQPGIRTGSCATSSNGFYYDNFQFVLMRVGLEDLRHTMQLPSQGGTVAVVLDGTKPVDESLVYLAQVIEKLLAYHKLLPESDISLVVFVNKADIASARLPPFAEYVKTHLKKIRKVNYAVFYTSPYLPVALDLVWDWMVAYSPKFDSSYLALSGRRGCCTLF